MKTYTFTATPRTYTVPVGTRVIVYTENTQGVLYEYHYTAYECVFNDIDIEDQSGSPHPHAPDSWQHIGMHGGWMKFKIPNSSIRLGQYDCKVITIDVSTYDIEISHIIRSTL